GRQGREPGNEQAVRACLLTLARAWALPGALAVPPRRGGRRSWQGERIWGRRDGPGLPFPFRVTLTAPPARAAASAAAGRGSLGRAGRPGRRLLMAAEGGGPGVRQDPCGGWSIAGGRAGARGRPRPGPAVRRG